MGEFGSLGYMRDDHVYLLSAPFKKHTFQTIFSKMEFETLPKVEIFYVHTDSDSELLEYMLNKYDGLVLAGTCFRKLYRRMYSCTCKSCVRGSCF